MLKRLVAAIVMCVLSLGIIFSTRQYKRDVMVKQQKQEIAKESEVIEEKSFDIWYEYNGYEEYLKYVAEEFTKETGIQVNLVCINDLGYATLINSTSIKGEGPDLYIAGTSIMENLYLSGIVSVISEDDIVNKENYAKKAVESVSYNGKICGYPLGYDVSVLAYNTNYIAEVPKSFEDIKSYVGYEEGGETNLEGISKVFEMESDDLLYNYGFFAEYLKVEKNTENGELIVSLDSEEAKAAAAQYVALKDYFGLSNDSRDYASIVADFAAGKTLFAILNTQIVGNEAFASLNYSAMPIPDFSEEIRVSAMSYTEMIIVNPYSDSIEDAKKFANMASYELADKMYEKCKILSTKRGIDYGIEIADRFFEAYEESISLPKYMETEDYALLVKNSINHIWEGQDIATILGQLQETYNSKNIN